MPLQEGLAGVRVVQAFGAGAGVHARFEATNEALYDANMETARITARYFPFVEYAGVLGIAMIVGLGGWFTDQGIVTVGTVAAFVLYLNNLFEPIQQLSQLYNTVQSAGAALNKLFELLDTTPSIAERPGAVDLPPTRRARGRRRLVRLRGAEPGAARRDARRSRRASGSRSSGPPAPGSRRWPS